MILTNDNDWIMMFSSTHSKWVCLFFIWPSCPELSELTPAQVRSPVSLASQAQTRTNNITGPIGYGKICSYRLKKSKFFSRGKIFSNFSFFQAGRPIFVRVLPNSSCFSRKFGRFFHFWLALRFDFFRIVRIYTNNFCSKNDEKELKMFDFLRISRENRIKMSSRGAREARF